MDVDSDEEALSWGTERDTTHVEAPEVPVAPAAPGDLAEPRTQISSALLIGYGVFAGAYVLFAAGWLVAVGHITLTLVDILPVFMYRLGEGFAVASPLLWFGGVLLLTRGNRLRSRILLLLLGLLLVAPWPFILGGVR